MAQWTFTLNGTSIKKITDINIKDGLTDPMKQMQATMRNPTSAERSFITSRIGHIIADHRVQIHRKGILKFDGFLEAADPAGLDLVLRGRSFEVLLLDERTGRDNEYIAQTGATILTDILSTYSTKITLSDITYPETLAGTVRFNHDNLLLAVAKVCNINSKDFWVTYTGAAFKLWVGTRGSGSSGSPTGAYTAGKEVSTTVEKKGVLDLINRVRVFGSGDGVNQIQVCVPWIDINLPTTDRVGGFDGYDASYLHAAATASQGTYGIMEGKPHIDRSINSKANAIEIAKSILDDSADIYQSLKVNFAKYTDLVVGDWIRVIDTKKGLDVTTRVKSLLNKYSVQGIDSINVELYNPFKSTEDRINTSERNSDTTNTSGQGATNIFQVQSYENCDATHPLNIRFRLPNDIVQVNKVLMSFNLKNYRAYHSDAGHSHETYVKVFGYTTAGDIYLCGQSYTGVLSGYQLLYDDVTNSTRTMNGVTSNAVSAVSYGISTITLSSPSVVVTAGIDGAETAVGTYTTNQTDVDIVANIGALGNWYNVIFTPNKAMRIEANIYVKCYIESK